MSDSIKLRTALRDGVLEVRMLIRHPMFVGGRTADGERVAPHFITEVSCRVNGELVMLNHWGAGVAKNPYLSFNVRDVAAGDELEIAWRDNQGGKDSLGKRV